MQRVSLFLCTVTAAAFILGMMGPGVVLAQEPAKPAAPAKKPEAAKPAAVKPAEAAGPKSMADVRLTTALKKLSLVWEELPDGVIKITIPFKGKAGGRSQVVLVSSRTQKLGNFEVRKICSTAFKSDKPLNGELANKLLSDNDLQTVGAWTLAKWDNSFRVLFMATAPADLEYDKLGIVIRAVCGKADVMEEELTSKDDL